VRQITEAFPWNEAPRYMIRDRDRIYGAAVTRRLRAMGIRDRPIAPASPWQNGFAERLIGSIRRECVDHFIVLGEAHLRRILRCGRRRLGRLSSQYLLAGVQIVWLPIEIVTVRTVGESNWRGRLYDRVPRHFALPCGCSTEIYQRPESMAMFGRRKRTRAHDAQQVHQRFKRNERFGRDIHARIAELRSVPREKLADTVFMLSMVAKQQSSLIQQSIKERAKATFDCDGRRVVIWRPILQSTQPILCGIT
jgi:transposase InsO family protein